jgi:uncharacterized membrane protein YhaH (DUF805 family)
MDYFFEAFRKYATFSGRSGLAAFWYFFLWHCSLVVALGTLFGVFFMGGLSLSALYVPSMMFLMLLLVYCLASLIPTIAVSVRRLHDTGRSGAWFLLNFIPLIGPLALLVLLAQAGNPGDNAYGKGA